MISSRDALSSVDTAITGARRDEDRLVAMLRAVTDEAARLHAQQLAGYKALALLKLDALSNATLSIELDLAEKKALQLLDRRKEALAKAEVERQKRADAVTAAEAALNEREAALDTAADAVNDLATKTRQRLAGEAPWIAADGQVKAAEATAAAAEAKASQSEADREEKRKPYEADRLFMYLWSRGFGTAQYRANPLVRYFDGKIARLVGYDTARPNYYMLNEIPQRLRAHVEQLKTVITEATAAREALERAALVADGIEPLEAAVEKADAAREAAEKGLAEQREKLAGADATKAELLDETKDPALQEAIGAIAEGIARKGLAELYQEAMRTPTPEDERIVQELRTLEGTLARKEAEAEEVRKTAVEMGRRRTELEGARARFRQSGYDDPYGQFSNEGSLSHIIAGILAGSLLGRDLDGGFRDGFSRRQRPSNGGFSGGFGGGFGGGSSHWGGSHGGSGGFHGGSSSGGGFHTGGSSHGGGFRTGGRF